jgi:hypothetical protein
MMHHPAESTTGKDDGAALVITHTIKAGEEGRYEDWLAEILGEVSRTPGYLGREILRPVKGSGKYTSIVRFVSAAHLRAWIDSDARKSFIDRVSDMLEKGDQQKIMTGIDFWFTPESLEPPKPWKQFLLTLTAVYPLSLLIPLMLNPLLKIAPALDHQLVRALLMAAILTALLTFVVMPPYTHLMKRWLFEETG